MSAGGRGWGRKCASPVPTPSRLRPPRGPPAGRPLECWHAALRRPRPRPPAPAPARPLPASPLRGARWRAGRRPARRWPAPARPEMGSPHPALSPPPAPDSPLPFPADGACVSTRVRARGARVSSSEPMGRWSSQQGGPELRVAQAQRPESWRERPGGDGVAGPAGIEAGHWLRFGASAVPGAGQVPALIRAPQDAPGARPGEDVPGWPLRAPRFGLPGLRLLLETRAMAGTGTPGWAGPGVGSGPAAGFV